MSSHTRFCSGRYMLLNAGSQETRVFGLKIVLFRSFYVNSPAYNIRNENTRKQVNSKDETFKKIEERGFE